MSQLSGFIISCIGVFGYPLLKYTCSHTKPVPGNSGQSILLELISGNYIGRKITFAKVIPMNMITKLSCNEGQLVISFPGGKCFIKAAGVQRNNQKLSALSM